MKLWGVGVLALSLAAAVTGLMTASCSDSNLGTSQGDGGASGCPTNPPTVGSTCLLASGTTCGYATPAAGSNCACCGGGGLSYACENGKWEEMATANGGAAGTGAAPACPETVPEAGSPCTSYSYGGCEGAPEQLCTYTCGPDGNQEAVCSAGSWTITTSGQCSDDGGDDAGDGGDASDGG